MKRIRRRDFFLFILASIVAGAAIFACAYISSGGVADADTLVAYATSPVSLIIMLVLEIGLLVMSVKRLHDMAASGWWAVFLIVPVLNLVMTLILMFWPGSRGPNPFGPNPRMRGNPTL